MDFKIECWQRRRFDFEVGTMGSCGNGGEKAAHNFNICLLLCNK